MKDQGGRREQTGLPTRIRRHEIGNLPSDSIRLLRGHGLIESLHPLLHAESRVGDERLKLRVGAKAGLDRLHVRFDFLQRLAVLAERGDVCGRGVLACKSKSRGEHARSEGKKKHWLE